jgi:hypothetical protein
MFVFLLFVEDTLQLEEIITRTMNNRKLQFLFCAE